MNTDLLIYAVAAGAVLGLILGATRAHMTGKATFIFMMLYYFLFTGLVNVQKWLIDGDPFNDNASLGFWRATLFALGAVIVVEVIRVVKRKKFKQYLSELEEKNNST